MIKKITYKPIGIIHSDYKGRENVPIQGSLSGNSKGWIEVFQEYKEGLKDIEGFSHIILIYHFHLSSESRLSDKPYLEDKEHGIFSIRSPRRPNPVGFSVVRLDRREKNILHVSEVDIIDNTPLLDIKPYVSKFDSRIDTKDGWLTEILKNVELHRSDDRHNK